MCIHIKLRKHCFWDPQKWNKRKQTKTEGHLFFLFKIISPTSFFFWVHSNRPSHKFFEHSSNICIITLLQVEHTSSNYLCNGKSLPFSSYLFFPRFRSFRLSRWESSCLEAWTTSAASDVSFLLPVNVVELNNSYAWLVCFSKGCL